MSEGSSRLRYFPITMLPSVMGLTGLAIVFYKLQHVVGLEAPLGRGLLYATSAWFGVIVLLYLAKFVRYREEVVKEFRHPVRVNFFPALSICLLLLSIGFLEDGARDIARVLWWIGAPLHLLLLLILLGRWFHTAHHIKSFNPAWFIPVVGPIIVPVAGVKLASPEISWFFFATGLGYWIFLQAVLTNRIFFHDPLPEKLLPTLFIMVAPPAVGFIAYVRLTGELDVMARILFYFGVFSALLLLTMIDRFRRVPYYMSWWAYTFPLDAFTLSLYLMYRLTGAALVKWAALGMTAVTTVTILVVLVHTINVARRGGICVPED
jgi:tellurite resistance protein